MSAEELTGAEAARLEALCRIAADQGAQLAEGHAAHGRHDDYPLSGEWADDVTLDDLLAYCAVTYGLHGSDDLYSDECDAIADAFEAAYAERAL